MVLSVIPINVVSTRVHTKARCATCGSVSVIPPSAGARVKAALVLHASAQPFIGAAAQHAAVADAAARPQDRSHFESRQHIIAFPIDRGGAAKRQPVGRPSIAQLSRS